MATLRAQDRLQPALLDRLTDDNPESRSESTEARVINRSRLRDMVLRDLPGCSTPPRPVKALTGTRHRTRVRRC